MVAIIFWALVVLGLWLMLLEKAKLAWKIWCIPATYFFFAHLINGKWWFAGFSFLSLLICAVGWEACVEKEMEF